MVKLDYTGTEWNKLINVNSSVSTSNKFLFN